MKVGDLVEWKGVNKTHSGRIVKRAKGDYIVEMDNGHSFSLKDLRYSKSVKLIES